MEVTIRYCDRSRVETDSGNNFIDINGMDDELGIRVDGHPHLHYVEVREKMDRLATFYFRNKGAKKHMDLGWWQDAEVVYAKNSVNK